MGDEGKLRVAIGVLVTTGGLVIADAALEEFTMPEGTWAVAVLAATYFFSSTPRRKRIENGDD